MNGITNARMLLGALAVGAALGLLLWGLILEGRWEPTSTTIVPEFGGDPAGPRS